MADVGYVNKEVQAMYGIPYSQLTAEQKRILHADSVRRAKLIEEREQAVLKNNLKAFADEAKMEKVLASIYKNAQKQILAEVTETISKVQKAGGTWSYANQSALTRSRGLFEQVTAELNKLGVQEQELFTQGLSNIYTDQFLRQVYELGQSIPVKANFNRLNPALIKQTLDYPWSGAMFSDRLWLDKETLGRNLRAGLTQSMILGEGIPEITDRINKGIDTSRYNAERIARTETKRVTYVAHNDAYEDMGVNELEYRIANGGDSRVCGTCRADNGKRYKRGEEPTLPRHPNCRCVYIPVVSDTFGDNELNELTGSVRGAENYEKWKAEQEKKLKKEKTPEDMIKERIEQDKKAEKTYRDGINTQIATKMQEHDNLPNTYAGELNKLEAERTKYKEAIETKRAELDKISVEREKIPEKRKEISNLLDEGKITEDEYDIRNAKIREERKALSSKFSEIEVEYYSLYSKVDDVEEKIRRIDRDIKQKQQDILQEVKGLNTKIQESLDKELDYDLDILFVGNDELSKMRYNHIEEFRVMRTSLKKNTTFDYDNYKDELVQMAKRMDEDALVINSKMSAFVEKNWYNDYNGEDGAHYSPAFKRVHMKMEENSHEKALGNGLKGSWQTKYHEEGHQLDHLLAKVEDIAGKGNHQRAFTHTLNDTGKEIVEAIEKDILSFLNTAIQYSNDNEGQAYKPLKNMSRISKDARFAFNRYIKHLNSGGVDRKVTCELGILSDAIGLFTEDRISPHSYGLWGHRSSYNKDRGKSGATSETWATFFAIRTCGSTEEVELAKKVMPETWSCLDKVYHKLAGYLKNNDLSY